MLTLYVNPNAAGKDTFASIEDAKAYIRTLRTQNALPAGGITVSIAPGDYRLPKGLHFTAEDSGTGECPITYAAEIPHKTRLSGGVTLRAADFVPLSEEEAARLYDRSAAEHIRKLDLGRYGITSADIGVLYANGSHILADRYDNGTGDGEAELFFGGRRMTLARYPNDEYLHVASVIDEGDKNSTIKEGLRNPRGGTFRYDEETAEHVRAWRWHPDLWTFGYYRFEWTDTSIRIKSLDAEASALTLEQACIYGIREDARYYFFNVFEELDAPGEYYIDRDSCTLYFYAPDAIDAKEIVLTVTTESLLRLDGASHLCFSGLEIAYTRGDAVCINGGFDIYGTWSNRMPARNQIAEDGSHITIENCRIYAVRQMAVNGHGTALAVCDCEIFNIGTNGVYLSGGDRNTLTSSDNRIENNHIHDWSQAVFTYCGAVGMQGCGAYVGHNELHDATHFAILYLGNDHLIEYNDISRVCMDTDDCGAIYTGRSYSDRGTVIQYNYIHDVGRKPDGRKIGTAAEGIYFDDLMSGQTVIGNILENITGMALQLGGGRDYIVEDNIFINCRVAINHCVRGWDGVFAGGWYGNMFTVPDQRELGRLHSVPYQGEIWAKRYPELARTKFTLDGVDRDDPLLAVNPSGSVILRNVCYPGELGCTDEIHDRVRVFSHVEALCYLDTLDTDFADAKHGDYTIRGDAALWRYIPSFRHIPFDRIGRTKKA